MNTAEKRAGADVQGAAGESWFSDYSLEGLRIRYRPPCRIHSVFFAVVPWLNVLLLVLAFVMFSQSNTVVPGMTVDIKLPEERANGGMRSSIALVARSVPRAPDAGDPRYAEAAADDGAVERPMDLVLFFHDSRFNLSQPHQIASFRNNIAAEVRRLEETDALLYIDKNVTQKDTMRLAVMLRDAGVERVCFVVKPPLE